MNFETKCYQHIKTSYRMYNNSLLISQHTVLVPLMVIVYLETFYNGGGLQFILKISFSLLSTERLQRKLFASFLENLISYTRKIFPRLLNSKKSLQSLPMNTLISGLAIL